MKGFNLIQNRFSVLLASALLFTASCGGGSDSDSGSSSTATATGVFLDSPVGGLSYTSGGQSGTTNPDGSFTYEVGKAVNFFIGDVALGKASPESGDNVITPLHLTAALDNTDATTQGIGQILMTLDEDDDATNGITISQTTRDAAAGQTADLSQPGTDLAALVLSLVPGKTLVTPAAAESHLNNSRLLAMSGSYSGTYIGTCSFVPVNGVWTLVLDDAGNVTGSSSEAGPFTGTMSANGSASGTYTDLVGSTWAAQFKVGGVALGTWDTPSVNCSGTAKTAKTTDVVTVYDGTYNFNSTCADNLAPEAGVWAFTVANGAFSGVNGAATLDGTLGMNGAATTVSSSPAGMTINGSINTYGSFSGTINGSTTCSVGGFKAAFTTKTINVVDTDIMTSTNANKSRDCYPKYATNGYESGVHCFIPGSTTFFLRKRIIDWDTNTRTRYGKDYNIDATGAALDTWLQKKHLVFATDGMLQSKYVDLATPTNPNALPDFIGTLDANGKVAVHTFRNGNQYLFTYNGDGTVATATMNDPVGATMFTETYTYAGGLLTGILNFAGKANVVVNTRNGTNQVTLATVTFIDGSGREDIYTYTYKIITIPSTSTPVDNGFDFWTYLH